MNRLPVRWVKRAGLVSLGAYAVFTVWLQLDQLHSAARRPAHASLRTAGRRGRTHESRGSTLRRSTTRSIASARTPGPSRPQSTSTATSTATTTGKTSRAASASFRPFLYAHIETATHRFLTSHSSIHATGRPSQPPGLHLTHEGDGENLQVVVEKAGGHVVLLFTQAHYRGKVYASAGAPGASQRAALARRRRWSDRKLRHACRGLRRSARPRDLRTGRRAHASPARRSGRSAVRTPRARAPAWSAGRARSASPGWMSPTPVPYQLESTIAKVWPGVKSGELPRPWPSPGRLGPGMRMRAFPSRSRSSTAVIASAGHYVRAAASPPFAVDFGWSPRHAGIAALRPGAPLRRGARGDRLGARVRRLPVQHAMMVATRRAALGPAQPVQPDEFSNRKSRISWFARSPLTRRVSLGHPDRRTHPSEPDPVHSVLPRRRHPVAGPGRRFELRPRAHPGTGRARPAAERRDVVVPTSSTTTGTACRCRAPARPSRSTCVSARRRGPAGGPAAGRLHHRPRRTARCRRLSLALVIDRSGSMAGRGQDGPGPGGPARVRRRLRPTTRSRWSTFSDGRGGRAAAPRAATAAGCATRSRASARTAPPTCTPA